MKLSFPGTRRTLAYLFALCGTALFIHLVRSVGAAKILRSIQHIGWGMLAVVAVVIFLLAAFGKWPTSLRDDVEPIALGLAFLAAAAALP